MLKNNSLADKKEFPKYIPRQPKKTTPRPIIMAFLYPNFGKNEAMKKETIAMGKSLNASKIDAFPSVTP